MMDQEKNKISKEAVCHTKKITQKHAQLELAACVLYFVQRRKFQLHKTCSQDARSFKTFSIQAELLFQLKNQ